MWKVPVSIPGFGNVNYPSICPLSPKRGHAFCEKHCMKAKQLGFPSGLREFDQRCGVNKANIDKGIQHTIKFNMQCSMFFSFAFAYKNHNLDVIQLQ